MTSSSSSAKTRCISALASLRPGTTAVTPSAVAKTPSRVSNRNPAFRAPSSGP